MKQKRATVYFKGRVQGVWFRGYTKQQADRQQVSGWVQNRLDGSVEALFEGAESTVRSLISTCQNGPPSARVEEITIEWQAATGEFSSFEILN